MPGSLSNWLELELLDHVLKVGAYIVPSNIYIALFVGDPTDTGGGGSEVSGNNYARVIMNSWDPASSRATENTDQINFAEATGSWGTVTHFAIYDALTGGHFLAHGSLAASKAIGTGDNVYFVAGDIDIVFSAGGICTNLANKLLDHVFKTTSHTVETNLYIALYTSSPTDSGTSGSEVSGGSYARKAHNTWDTASNGASENTGVITFVTATASWGTITYFLMLNHLSNAPSSSNTLLWGVLDNSRAIGIDDVAEFADGALDITLD